MTFEAKVISEGYSVGIDNRQNFFRTMFFGESKSGSEIKEQYELLLPDEAKAGCTNLGGSANIVQPAKGTIVYSSAVKIFEEISYNEITRKDGNRIIMGGVAGYSATDVQKAAQETLERRFVAREDWMCAQLLTQGVVIGTDAAGNVVDGGVQVWHTAVTGTGATFANATAASDPILAATENWSTGDPAKDIIAAQQLARSLGSRNPDALVMGSEVINQFLVNADVKDLLDKSNIEAGRLRLDAQSSGVLSRDPGVTFYGTFLGLDVYGCSDSNRMNSKSALIASYTAGGARKMRYCWQNIPSSPSAQSTLVSTSAERAIYHAVSFNPPSAAWYMSTLCIPYSPWKWNAIVLKDCLGA